MKLLSKIVIAVFRRIFFSAGIVLSQPRANCATAAIVSSSYQISPLHYVYSSFYILLFSLSPCLCAARICSASPSISVCALEAAQRPARAASPHSHQQILVHRRAKMAFIPPRSVYFHSGNETENLFRPNMISFIY